ncbi:MAG: HD domain-containing protein, partial [Lachnospiraceae bacterium]|nr:HD domain-containing protein [Lachnospiraceae bacterium]
MRYVPINQLKPGMVLGQELYDASGHMLLGKYTKLTEDHISYMLFIGVMGIYVDDDFSRDVQIKEIVQPEVRKKALKTIGVFFGEAAGGDIPGDESHIAENVKNIVQGVLDNEDVMYNMIEIRTYDEYTYFHSANVAILSGVIGAKCGLSEQELSDVVTAGFLHDIGKVFIDPEIINAPRQLTQEEKLKMKDHPTLGYEFLTKNFNFGKAVNNAVYEHHEWYNGNGYPRRLRGEEIQKISRILKLA